MRQEAQCGIAAAPGLIGPPLVKIYDRLIEVEQRQPDPVLFASEALTCLGKQLQSEKWLAVLVGRDAEERQGLSGLVTHLQLLKAGEGLPGELRAFFCQVQLEVH